MPNETRVFMSNHLLHTLQSLRSREELVLYDRLASATPAQVAEVEAWLAEVWQEEYIALPASPPPFHAGAARWGALTLYTAGQLLLNRAHNPGAALELLPSFAGTIDAGALLSADLLLRFLPDVLRQLVLIDPDDALVAPLEEALTRFHYSGIGYPLAAERFDWSAVQASDCLRLCYSNRVIAAGAVALGRQPALRAGIDAALGLHAAQLWPAWQKTDT